MDLFTINTRYLRPEDLSLYARLELEWAIAQDGPHATRPTWNAQPVKPEAGDAANDRIGVPLEYRVWALMACIQMYLEWRAAATGAPRAIDQRYADLADWMAQELYGVFPSDNSPTAIPLRMLYGEWIRFGLDISFQQALFGRVHAPASGTPFAPAEGQNREWAVLMECLVQIAGRLTIAEALSHLPHPQLDAAGAYRDVYLRGRALRFGERVFPEWCGLAVPAEAETLVLSRLRRQVQLSDADDLVALEWYGLGLTLDLSEAAWRTARKVVAMERRRRSQGPSVRWIEQEGWSPEIWSN